jgi:deoxyribonuclease-4
LIAIKTGSEVYDRPRMVTAASTRRVGPHLPLGGGLLKAAERAKSIGATAVQVFTDNPTAWRRRQEPPRALADFRTRLRDAGIGPVAVHAPYLINLCGANEDFWTKSIATVANELRVGATYGAAFVVMHVGSHRGLGRQQGIQRLVAGMDRALADAARRRDTSNDGESLDLPMLVLENATGSGDGIGASLEDLADILALSSASGLPMERIGVCLDTAHLWGAGYDVSDQDGVAKLVERIDGLLGRDKVVMLHLNDSRTTLGSKLDRHEHIGAGQVGENGMRELLSEPWLATLPTFLETPGMDEGYDKVNLDRVRMVVDGEALPKLPPEAFATRGSRTRTPPPDA